MAEVSIGEVIFTAIKPLTKIVALAGCGAIFARKGILDVATCRSMASVVINGFMPLLIFASTVSSFSLDNISEAGMVLLSATFFVAFGFVFGFLIRFLTPVGSWKMGIIANNAWSNNGDLVIGIVSTLSQTKPFGRPGDYEQGVSYASIFMVFTFLTLYSMGGIQMIERDFTNQRARDEEGGRTKKTDDKPASSSGRRTKASAAQPPSQAVDQELPEYEEKETARTNDSSELADNCNNANVNSASTTAALSKTTSLDVNRPPRPHEVAASQGSGDKSASASPEPLTKWQRTWVKVKLFITIPSMTLLSALVISIVPQLRALFVPTKGVSMPNAPDGRPPLDFIIQFASYGGQLSPVMGLAMLGAALARIRVRHLPKGFWMSIVATCVLKLIVGPILGIIWIQGLKKSSNLINDDQKMMQLVIAVTCAMPAATSQVYITTLFAPDDSPEMSQLSASLLAQYALMIITLPIVVSYTLLKVI